MSKFGAFNTMGFDDGYNCGQSVHRVHAPKPDRRVIFPSLHTNATAITSASPPTSSYPQPIPGPRQPYVAKKILPKNHPVKSIEFIPSPKPSPTHVDSNIRTATLKPTLLRANSLDELLIPLPKLSIGEDDKSDQEVVPLRPLSQKPRAQYPIHTSHETRPQSILSAPPSKKWATNPIRARSSSVEKSPIFGGGVQHHRTYYPAASIPTPVKDKKPPLSSKPISSILRRKSSFSSVCSSNEGGASTTTPAQTSQMVDSHSLSLSPAVPPLASPASIKTLHPHRSDTEGQESIGESEGDLERMGSAPKVLPRKPCEVRRIRSDTIVRQNEGSNDTGVSRHASLECLANNKKISFDPHIRVFEFPITDYEKRGGEKWFSEDELAGFKQQAIQRIRLRSMTKILPTGTGRSLTVTPKENQGNASKNGGNPKGSINFNHPALGCEDEFDESGRSRKCSEKGALSLDRASAITAQEIRNVLVVDPHQIFLSLFSKSLKHMIPHASVATARSVEEAMTKIEAARKAFPLSDGGSTHGFDIIVIEERLPGSFSGQQLASGQRASLQRGSTQTAGDDSAQRRWDMTSGSALIRYLVESECEISKSEARTNGGSLRRSLLVGVSARLSLDREKLVKSGADCTWGKPPPEMNTKLRNELLKLLMKKRNRKENIV